MTQDLSNFEKSCRVCFNLINENPPISLIGTIRVDEFSVITISEALQEIYPFFLQVADGDDCLPRNICFECLNNLKISYKFRKICEITNQKMLKILIEHESLYTGRIQESNHYKYDIKACHYFKDLLVKQEAVESNFEEIGQVKNEETYTSGRNIENDDAEPELIDIQNVFKKAVNQSVEHKPLIENEFKCESCSKTFQSRSELNQHKETHENKYQCDLCNKSFVKEHNLNWHKRRHASDANFPHLCPECGKQFLTSAEFVRHSRTHVNMKLYECNVCLRKFSQSYGLKMHKLRHTGYRPNVCETCGKRFTTVSNLNEHKRTHLPEKPHKCLICGKTWVTSSDLKKHMRIHSGEKPYSCQYCVRKFARKEAMRVHERIHTGEKPYSCNVCNKGFVHLSSYERHVKSDCGSVQKTDA